MMRRGIVIVPVAVALVVAAAGLTAWREHWPPGAFGSAVAPSAVGQVQTAEATKIGANSSTPYRIGDNAYVSDLTAWNSLPATLKGSALARLRVAEQRFRARGSGVVPQQPLVSVRSALSPHAELPGTARPAADSAVLMAARSADATGAVSADFGATEFGASALSFGAPGMWGWTPCVSITLRGGQPLRLCGGAVVGMGNSSAQAGLTGSGVATIGEAAAQAYVPVTAAYANTTGRAQTLTVTGSVASVSMTLSEPSLSAAGCDWSKLRYDAPAAGTLTPLLATPPMIDTGDCLSTFSLHVALPNPYLSAVTAGMTAAQKVTTFASDAYSTVAGKSQLASSPALQACAAGNMLADLAVFLKDFGALGAPSCQPVQLPAWRGTVQPGQTLQFTVTPATWAVDGGAGTEIDGLFSFVHLHVASAPAPAQPAIPDFYVHNGYELGSLYQYPGFPDTIWLDNHDWVSGLEWARPGAASATATGTLHSDTCTPNCAAGTLVTYPVQLTSTQPQRCAVKVYYNGIDPGIDQDGLTSGSSRTVQAYVFGKTYLSALSGHPPGYLTGYSPALSPACGPPAVGASPVATGQPATGGTPTGTPIGGTPTGGPASPGGGQPSPTQTGSSQPAAPIAITNIFATDSAGAQQSDFSCGENGALAANLNNPSSAPVQATVTMRIWNPNSTVDGYDQSETVSVPPGSSVFSQPQTFAWWLDGPWTYSLVIQSTAGTVNAQTQLNFTCAAYGS